MYIGRTWLQLFIKKKTMKKQKKEGYKSYNIQVLWQYNYDLGLIFDISNQQQLGIF